MIDFLINHWEGILTLIGTCVTVVEAIKTVRAKNEAIRCKDEIRDQIKNTELTILIEKGNSLRARLSYIWRWNSTQSNKRGISEGQIENETNQYLTEVNSKRHLVKSKKKFELLYKDTLALLLDQNDQTFDTKCKEAFKSVSDIIALLEESKKQI